MPRILTVTYSITKQIRQYEPVRVEVTVANDEGPAAQALDAEALLTQARDACERGIQDAIARAQADAAYTGRRY
jgi:hypothetical protein